MVPVLHPFLRKVKSFSRFARHLAVLCFAPVFLLCADVPESFCGFSRFFQFAQFIVDSGTGFILYWTGRNHLRSQDSFIWHSKCISPDEAVRRAYARHTTEGARAQNSQVTELIADGTLESRIAAPTKQSHTGESFRSGNRARHALVRSIFIKYAYAYLIKEDAPRLRTSPHKRPETRKEMNDGTF